MAGWAPNPPPPNYDPLVENCDPGDIRILWDNVQGLGDWGYAIGDLLTGQDLETACLTSLFSDALATPDFVPTDGTTDRRGWWADTYLDVPLGSNLWQLDRAKTTRANLGLARNTAQRALQWLVDDGVAQSLNVDAQWVSPTMLGLIIRLSQPNGPQTKFMFLWAWQSLTAWPGPVCPPAALPGVAPPPPEEPALENTLPLGYILTPRNEKIGVQGYPFGPGGPGGTPQPPPGAALENNEPAGFVLTPALERIGIPDAEGNPS
jgi:phage gp46-like protein